MASNENIPGLDLPVDLPSNAPNEDDDDGLKNEAMEEDTDQTRYLNKIEPNPISSEITADQSKLDNTLNFNTLDFEDAEFDYALLIDSRVRQTDISKYIKHIQDISRERNIAARRHLFEQLLQKFPHSGRHWVMYIDSEKKDNNFEFVDALFKRCLLTTNSMNIWEAYIKYMKSKYKNNVKDLLAMNDLKDDEREMKKLTFQQQMKSYFEFALKFIGFHFRSAKIWRDYLDFIQEIEAKTQFEINEKNEWLRSVFVRVCVLPILTCDQLYKDYERFEMNINKLKAAQVINEVSQKHSKALIVLKERRNYWNGIVLGMLPEHYKGTRKELEQVSKWMNVMLYEQTNPEQLTDGDELKARIRFYFTEAIGAMRFYPEIWYAFAQYELMQNDFVSAEVILKKGIVANPDSLYLGFALADLYEKYNQIPKARSLYKKLLKGMRQLQTETEQAKLQAGTDLVQATNTEENVEFVYVQYMKFVQRVDGPLAARAIFEHGRKQLKTPVQLILSAAWLEYIANKNSLRANSIFEFGLGSLQTSLKLKSELNTLCVEYAKFISQSILDDDVVFSAFEKIISTMNANEAKEDDSERDKFLWVWERFRDFAAQRVNNGGDLSLLASVDVRIAKTFPETRGFLGLQSIKYRYEGFGTTSVPTTESDKSFHSRASSTGLKYKTELVEELLGGDENETGHRGVDLVMDESIPEFMRKLVALLPDKLRGSAPDADLLLSIVKDLDLGERPTDDYIPGVIQQTLGQKRGRNTLEEEEDIFSRRQKQRL